MPHVTNLNHAVLYVSDVARSLDFYLARSASKLSTAWVTRLCS